MKPSRCPSPHTISILPSFMRRTLGSLPVRALISAESLSASASLPPGASALATARPEASLRLHTCHTPSCSRSACRRPRRLSESSVGSCRPAPLGLGPSAHGPHQAAVAPEALQPQGARLPTPLRHLQGLPVGIPTPPKPSGAYGLRTRQKASADPRSRGRPRREAIQRHGISAIWLAPGGKQL